MIMKEVEIDIVSLSEPLKPSRTTHGLLIQEKGGSKRKLGLIIGNMEARSIRMAWKKYDLWRPFTHRLFLNSLATLGAKVRKGLIYDVEDGIYYSRLFIDTSSGELIQEEVRTTDMLTLSIYSGFPVMIDDELLSREQWPSGFFDDESVIPQLPDDDIDILQEKMHAAVMREDFEEAAEFRDLIKLYQMKNRFKKYN